MVSRRRKRKDILKEEQRKIAKERIEILMKLAEMECKRGNLEIANDLVKLARRIGMKLNVKIPKEFKRRICRKCYSYLYPGISCRVRINSNEKRVEIKCFNCGYRNYYGYGREIKERRRAKFISKSLK
ncbi:MAG TPA: hypothetical protein ENG50_04690 [Candidatus Altiarchaeales archaeon]|nr:MAG: hypothetical protein DRO65_02170 [Candidatus Altiarchaeales archaeon]HDN83642.1 hypothetical protein [Candidatus Altiarchaeales archaeon]